LIAISEAKSAARREMNFKKPDRKDDLQIIIDKIKEEDAELLERLEND
jgi:hypothetical protein